MCALATLQLSVVDVLPDVADELFVSVVLNKVNHLSLTSGLRRQGR